MMSVATPCIANAELPCHHPRRTPPATIHYLPWLEKRDTGQHLGIFTNTLWHHNRRPRQHDFEDEERPWD
jgi:hypothetical protein